MWEIRAGGRSQTVRGTAKDAERALTALNASTAQRNTAGRGVTLDELLTKWLSTARLERATVESYTAALAHLPAKLRGSKLGRLSIADFDQLYRDLERAGTGVQTIRKVHTALSSALTEAVRWRWLDTHPARGARLPRIEKRTAADHDERVLAALLATAAATDVQTGIWVRLALTSGARRSEILALRWSKVDLRRATVTVASSLEEDRTVKTTKTGNIRTITLDAGTVAELRRWKTAQAERALAVGVPLAKDPWVLSNAIDSSDPWRPDGATQRFRRLCARAGVTGVRLHDLRHAHASMLLRDGVDPVTVAARLGDRVETVLGTYAHAMAGADRAAAETLGRRLGG